MNLIPSSLDNVISEFVNIADYQPIEHLKDIYMGYKNLVNNFSEVLDGMSNKLVKSLAEDGIIDFKIIKNRHAYSVFSIAKYKFHIRLLNENFHEISDALKFMGLKKNVTTFAHVHRFQYLHENKHLELIILDRPINKKKYFVKKENLNSFLEENINLYDAADIFKVSLGTLRQYWLNKYTDQIILFHNDNPELCFVNKVAWNSFAQEKSKYKLFSREKAARELNITVDNFNKVINEYSITAEKFKARIESATYFKEADIKNLKKIQDKLLKEHRSNYYTNKEAISLLGIKKDTLYNYTNQIKTMIPPPIIQTNFEGMLLRKSGSIKLYLKKDVEQLSETLNNKREFDAILYKLEDSSLNILLLLLDHQNISFNERGIETRDYWFKYVSTKLNK